MEFVANHDVTVDDVIRAMRLTRRWTDLVGGIAVVVLLVLVLRQVLSAFALYLNAAAAAPDTLMALLRFESGAGNAALAWLSVLVTLALPLFLFYAVRALAETFRPAWRARRLLRNVDVSGATIYTINETGVRSTKMNGMDVFMPWSAFDSLRSDAAMVVLLRGRRLLFFVPLEAFGAQRDAVLAHLKANVPPSRT